MTGPERIGRCEPLAAPFPWFGGKSRAAEAIWQRLGNVENYVEPFAGSLAVLLARPHAPKVETVNDIDAFISNFWRAVKWAPAEVAEHADWPVNEADLEARHYWLVTEGRERLRALLTQPEAFDAKVAGWWVWGICSWIGGHWCSGVGPWQAGPDGWTDRRKLPHLSDAGQGINRKLPHLGNTGQGINRQLPHLGNTGQGILDWFAALSARLRNVRVACGDWRRVTGPSVTTQHGITGVLLDPPYSAADRADVYSHDDFAVAREARAWAIEAGRDRLMRIAFCGYAGEFDTPWPDGWREWRWKAKSGYAGQGDGENRNAERERVWFSPHCLSARQPDLLEALFAEAGA